MKKNKKTIKSQIEENEGVSRRNFIAKTIFAGTGLAAGSLAFASQNKAGAQTGKRKNDKTKIAANSSLGRRKLGKLEVSAIGLGVQNMSRT